MVENYRKTVFCEVQFLKECLSQIDEERCDDACLLKRRLWHSIKNLLLSPDVKLFLDISDEDFSSEIKDIDSRKRKAAKKNKPTQLGDFEELLWELSYSQGGESNLHLKCLGKEYAPLDALKSGESPNLNAIYLTCKDADMCENFSRTYGITVLTSKKLEVDRLQFEDSGCAIEKEEKTGWKKVLQGKCNPCNALIIVDNYILSDSRKGGKYSDYLDDNLRKILQAILPDVLSVPFHLTVFAFGTDDNGQNKERLETIKRIVGELRPNLKCSISLFKIKQPYFHDRTILTNNLWIGCGSGFNLFKRGKSEKMTVVNIVNPYLTDTIQWARQAYSNMVKEIRKVMDGTEKFGYNGIGDSCQFYLGTGCNRLTE